MIVDVVIVLLVIAYALSGYRNGALVSAFSLVGVLGGAYGGTQLAPVLSSHLSSTGYRVLIALLTVLLLAVLGQALMVSVANRLRARLRSKDLRRVDAAGGAVIGVVAVLLVAWVLAVPLADSTVRPVASQVRQSRIVAGVDDVLPPQAQDVYRTLRQAINSTGIPSVFGDFGATPQTDTPAPDSALAVSPVVGQVQGSILKVQGDAPSCDRGLEGSSFVYAPEHLLTNAHVVAGTTSLQVAAPGQGALPATVVRFDPENDVAVLYVPGLTASPLTFASAPAANDADALVIGYPQDGPFDVQSARIRETLTATGRDIYDDRSVTRQIYSVRALVRPGNSGGPLLDAQGQVLGIVFATAVDVANTGFALTDAQVAGDAAAGASATDRVGTGACAAG